MPTDQLFKALLRAFLKELVELFFPLVAQRIDFKQVEFIDKELFTDLADGNRREPDMIAKVNTVEGEHEILLIHCEIQSRREQDFPFRMYEYYSLIRQRYKLPVYPIVIYLSAGTGGLHEEYYNETVFDEEFLHFRYHAVGLPDLSADDYLERANPLAAALSALMRSDKWSKVRHKLLSLQQIAVSEIDDARRSLLANVIESFLPLSARDEVEFKELAATESEEVLEMISIYEERGIQQGIEQGIQQGIEQGIEQGITRGKREVLLRLMQAKFGPLPKEIVQKVESITENDLLDDLSVRLLIANSLEEMSLEG